MVLTCPQCGTLNSSNYRFCSKCGAQLTGSEQEKSTSDPGAQESGGFAVRSWDQGQASDPPSSDEASTTGDSGPYETAGGGHSTVRTPVSGEVLPPSDSFSGPPRADLPPNAGESSDRATFVPYTDESGRRLEKQTSNTAWLMPTIYAAAAVLLVLVGITIYLLLSKGTPTPGSQIASGGIMLTATPPPTLALQAEATSVPATALVPLTSPQEISLPCSLPAGATTDQTIIYTVCHSSEEQIKAWRDLDTEVLKGSRTGFDLQDNIARVEKYKTDKQYADPVLHKLVIVAIKSDQASAFVQTSEVWSVTTYSSIDKSVVDKKDPTNYSETYHLVKQGDKWFIDKVEFNSLTTPGD